MGITREKEGKGEQIDHMIGQIVESGVSGEQYMSNLYLLAAKEEVRENYARFLICSCKMKKRGLSSGIVLRGKIVSVSVQRCF